MKGFITFLLPLFSFQGSSTQTLDTTFNSSDSIVSIEVRADWQKCSRRICEEDYRLTIRHAEVVEKSNMLLTRKDAVSHKGVSQKHNPIRVPVVLEEVKILVTNDQGMISTQPIP